MPSFRYVGRELHCEGVALSALVEVDPSASKVQGRPNQMVASHRSP